MTTASSAWATGKCAMRRKSWRWMASFRWRRATITRSSSPPMARSMAPGAARTTTSWPRGGLKTRACPCPSWTASPASGAGARHFRRAGCGRQAMAWGANDLGQLGLGHTDAVGRPHGASPRRHCRHRRRQAVHGGTAGRWQRMDVGRQHLWPARPRRRCKRPGAWAGGAGGHRLHRRGRRAYVGAGCRWPRLGLGCGLLRPAGQWRRQRPLHPGGS